MIENQTDKYQDAYQKALSNIQDPTDVQKKALEYGEELEKTIEQYNSRDRRYGGIKEDEENV